MPMSEKTLERLGQASALFFLFLFVYGLCAQTQNGGGGSTQNTVTPSSGGGGSFDTNGNFVVNGSWTFRGVVTNTAGVVITNFMNSTARRFYYPNGNTAIDIDSSNVGDFTLGWNNGQAAYTEQSSSPEHLHVWHDDSGNLQMYLGPNAGLFLRSGYPFQMNGSLINSGSLGKFLASESPTIIIPIAQYHAITTNQLSTEIPFLSDNYGVTNYSNFMGRHARGTSASPSALLADDVLVAIGGRGYGATTFTTNSRASIGMHSAEPWSDTAQGSYIRFSTTSNTTSTLVERMRIMDNGRVGIGTTNAQFKLHVTGDIFSTNEINAGRAAIGTNALGGAAYSLYINHPAGQGNNYVAIDGPASELLFGDWNNSGNRVELGMSGVGSDFRINLPVAGNVTISDGGSTMITITSSGNTLGATSASTLTLNGNTMAIPNNLNVNSGGLWLPTSLTTASTNGWQTNQFLGDVRVLRGAIFSNVVVQTTTGTSSISSGTNLTFNIDANAGAGTIRTKGQFVVATNTITAPSIAVVNTIYTNNDTRLYLNIGVVLPSSIGGGSAAAIWQLNGTFTNYQSIVASEPGVTSAETNNCTAFIGPNALYMITNVGTVGGTPSLIQGLWNEIRF